MPANVATAVYAVVILGLFVLGRDRASRPSKALWIPVVAFLITGSKPVSVWLGIFGLGAGAPVTVTPEQFVDGSPADRALSLILIVLSLIVLTKRHQQVGTLLRQNVPILLFFAYCALSVLWSDYTFVAFKRWVKGVGDLLVVLVVLSEAQPEAALRKFFSRTAFILVPLSVLFIKYYPELGRTYNPWTFLPMQTGACMTKNGLGMLCMICGFGCLWQFITVYRDRKAANRMQQLLAHGTVLAMIFWLLSVADSVTALVCFVIAGTLMVVTSVSRIARRPFALQVLVISIVCLSSAALFADSAGWLVSALGREPTLTGRTNIWKVVISVAGNSWFGTGFESFWTGKRLTAIWDRTMDGLNEAHNGYLEVYLNLGWVGAMLLAGLIVTGYRNVIGAFRRPRATTVLKLGLFVAALLYNWTEAGFRETTLVWISFLLATTLVPYKPFLARDPSPARMNLEHRALREVEA